MPPRSLAVALAALVASGVAHADDAPRDVTLAEVAAALPQAPATPIAAREIAAADAAVDAARAWPSAPSVRIETNRLSARLVAGVGIPLPIFGTIGAARDEAAAKARVVRREVAVALRDLRRRAVDAWIALARADALVDVRATSAKQADALEGMTKHRLDAGAGAEVDVTAAVAAHARANVAVSAARREQAAAAAELAAILGWDPLRALHAAGPLPGSAAIELDALRAHVAAHPERAAALARIDAAQAARDRASLAGRPSIGLELAASFHDPTTPGTDVLVGVTFDFPIFSHVADQVRAAEATTAAERTRLAVADAQLAGGLVAAYRRWQAASETATSLAHDVLPAQERATTLAEQAYREGARDLGTALQAERDLAAVRADLATARADLAAAWIELQLAAGEEPGSDAR